MTPPPPAAATDVTAVTPATAPAGAALRWADLVAQAALGTSRRPQPPAGVIAGHPLGDHDEPEHAVLAAAAALGAARRASPVPQDPPPADRSPAPAPPDQLPLAPDRAQQLLDVILAGEVVQPVDAAPVLQAWLAACDASGHRVGPPALPALLHRLAALTRSTAVPAPDATPSTIDPAITGRAVGVRGRWLAHLDPAWTPLVSTPADLGRERLLDRIAGPVRRDGAPTRPQAVVALRQLDRPAAADALTTWWPTATVEERSALLHLLTAAADLGPDDEGWLEPALDDRAPRVTRAAAGALSRLPASRRAARMADRLRAIATVERHRLQRRLQLQRPDPPSPEELRDAASEPPVGGDVTGWWQAEIVTAAPLRTWVDLAGSPVDAVRLAADRAGLLHQLADAAVRQADRAWQAAVLDGLLQGVGLGASELATLTGPLASRAEHAARSARIDAVTRVAGALPTPWPPATGRQVLAWALAHPTPGPALAALRQPLATGLAPDMVATVRDHEGYSGTDARQVVLTLSRLRHILSLRHEITTAFSPSADQPDHHPDPMDGPR